MKITGKTMIFKNDIGYSTSISNKKEDGTYDRMYISIQLPKGVELENKTFINVTEGFLSFYKTKEGLPKLKLVVQKYELDAEEQYAKEEREAIQNEDSYDITRSDLPF